MFDRVKEKNLWVRYLIFIQSCLYIKQFCLFSAVGWVVFVGLCFGYGFYVTQIFGAGDFVFGMIMVW